MRALVLITALALACLSHAQKADIVAPNSTPFQPGAGVGIAQIAQMVLALAIVIGALKFVLPRLAPMLSKKLNTNLSSTIKIEETATFAGGNLYVVTARSKTILLSCSQSGVQYLADLSEENPKPEEPAFFELVDQAQTRPIRAAAWLEETPQPEPKPEKLQEALRRLERLVH